MRKSMQKNISRGVALLAAGVGSALAAVEAADHGARNLTVSAALLAGASTALGVTSVLVGLAGRRPSEDTER